MAKYKFMIHICALDRDCRKHMNFPSGLRFEDPDGRTIKISFPWGINLTLGTKHVLVRLWPSPTVKIWPALHTRRDS